MCAKQLNPRAHAPALRAKNEADMISRHQQKRKEFKEKLRHL